MQHLCYTGKKILYVVKKKSPESWLLAGKYKRKISLELLGWFSENKFAIDEIRKMNIIRIDSLKRIIENGKSKCTERIF